MCRAATARSARARRGDIRRGCRGRVVAARAERVAARQARDSQPEPAPGAVLVDRLQSILRAGGHVPAVPADIGLQRPAIEVDRRLQQRCRRRSCVGLTRLVREHDLAGPLLEAQVDVGILGVLVRDCACRPPDRLRACALLLMSWWPFASPAGKQAAMPGRKHLLARVRDERQLAVEHVDELVLAARASGDAPTWRQAPASSG